MVTFETNGGFNECPYSMVFEKLIKVMNVETPPFLRKRMRKRMAYQYHNREV